MARESTDLIRSDLRRLADGEGATLAALRSSGLVRLESVVADASGGGAVQPTIEGLATSAHRFLVEAARSLELDPASREIPNRARAAEALFGIAANSRGKHYQAVKGRPGRQALVAEWLGIPRERVDRPGRGGISPRDTLIGDVAECIVLRENEYSRDLRELDQRLRRGPLQSAMRLEWVPRFERYARLSACVSGVRYDVELSLDALNTDADADVQSRMLKALYYFAAYLTELESFYEHHGLLWIFPNARAEDAISDASWFIRKFTTLDEYDQSSLRIAFANTSELVPFADGVLSTPTLTAILSRWEAWLRGCNCAKAGLDEDCPVHRMLEWATFFMEAMELQWASISDWYNVPREGSKVEPIDLSKTDKPPRPPSLDSLTDFT